MEAASHQATARPPGGPGPRRRQPGGQLGPGGGEAVLRDGQHQAQGARLRPRLQEAGRRPGRRSLERPGPPGPPGAGRAPAASRGGGPREGAGDQQVVLRARRDPVGPDHHRLRPRQGARRAESAGGWMAGTWMRRPAKLAGRVVGVEVEVLSETACWARTAPGVQHQDLRRRRTWAPRRRDGSGRPPGAPWRRRRLALPAASRRRCSRAWVR